MTTKIDLSKWFEDTSFDYLNDGEQELNGVKVSVQTFQYDYDNNVSQEMFLTDYNVTYKRDGYKDIVYERWIDNIYYSWELV